MITDTDIVNWLQQQARKSYTGVSFDFHKDGNEPRFRYMQRHYSGPERYTLRDAAIAAMNELAGKEAQ